MSPNLHIDLSEILADTEDGGCFINIPDEDPPTDEFSKKIAAINARLGEIRNLRDKANQIIQHTQVNYPEGVAPADVAQKYKLAEQCLPILASEKKKLKKQLANFKYQHKDYDRKLANRRLTYDLLDYDKKQARATWKRKHYATPKGKEQQLHCNRRYRQKKRDKRELERLQSKLGCPQ